MRTMKGSDRSDGRKTQVYYTQNIINTKLSTGGFKQNASNGIWFASKAHCTGALVNHGG